MLFDLLEKKLVKSLELFKCTTGNVGRIYLSPVVKVNVTHLFFSMKSQTLLLCFISLIDLVTTASPNYELVGESFTFSSGINTPEPPNEILWKHNGNKVVEFNGQEEKTFNQFKDRVTLNWHTAELTVPNLKYEDSGEYVVEIFSKENMKTGSFRLEVIDPVPKPSISCKINAESNATLTCSAEVKGPSTKLEFSWNPPGNEKSSSKLEIKLGDKQDSEVYKCMVKSQLSEEFASFTAKDCYPAEGISSGVIVGIVVTLLALLIIFIFFLYKKGYLFKKQKIVGYYDEEKQAPLDSANDVKENNGGGSQEKKCLLGREETMLSKQPIFQGKTDSRKYKDEIPSSPSQPPLKPSRSIVLPSKSQTLAEEGKVSGDAEEKGPESDPLPSEKATHVEPEKNQHEIPSSPPQPPLKPSRSIVYPPKSQTSNEKVEVSGDAEEKGPQSDPLPREKATDVQPVSVELHNPSMTDTEPFRAKEAIKETETKVPESDPSGPEQKTGGETVSVELHNPSMTDTEPFRAKEAIKETKAKVPESDPSGPEQKTGGESVSEQDPVSVELHNPSMTDTEPLDAKEAIKEPKAKVPESDPSGPAQKTGGETVSNSEKKEKVSSPPSSRASVYRTDPKEPAEKAENPKENSSGIHTPVSKETTDVLPGSDVVGDEHKQPKASPDTSISAPAEPLALPETQNVPKTPPNEAAEPEENGSMDQVSTEPSQRNAEEPEVKNLQNKNEAVNEVKTTAPPTSEPNPIGAGTQTQAKQHEDDKQVPPAKDDESQKANGHLSTHEKDQCHNSELEESFQSSPKLTPTEAKVESDSTSGEDKSKEDEEGAALSEHEQ